MLLTALGGKILQMRKNNCQNRGVLSPLYLCFKQNYLPIFFVLLSFSIAYNVVKIKYLVKVDKTKLIIIK